MTNEQQPRNLNMSMFANRADYEEAASAPEGWKLVPIEPTPQMMEAGIHAKRIRLLNSLRAIRDGQDPEELMGKTAGAEYRAMLAAAPPAPPAPAREPLDSWQTIETAPKDGTNVLLVNDKGNIAAALWLDGILGTGWFLRGGNKPDHFFNGHRGPTHWMPLPTPPQTKD